MPYSKKKERKGIKVGKKSERGRKGRENIKAGKHRTLWENFVEMWNDLQCFGAISSSK